MSDRGQLLRPHVSTGTKAVEWWRRVMVNNHHVRHHLKNIAVNMFTPNVIHVEVAPLLQQRVP